MNPIQAMIEKCSCELENIASQIELLRFLIGPVAIGGDMPCKESIDSSMIGIADHIRRVVADLDGYDTSEPDFSLLDSVEGAMREEAKTARCNGVAIVPPCVPGKTCRQE